MTLTLQRFLADAAKRDPKFRELPQQTADTLLTYANYIDQDGIPLDVQLVVLEGLLRLAKGQQL